MSVLATPVTSSNLRNSVASWAVFPFFWASFIKVYAFFGLFLLNIFLLMSIVFVDFAEVVRFVLT